MIRVVSVLFILLAMEGTAHAQQRIVLGVDSLFSVRQESIPPNDSGGRMVLTTLLVTSQTGLPLLVQRCPYYWIGAGHGGLSDSTLALADSVYLSDREVYAHPTLYKDSLLHKSRWWSADLKFIIQPYQTLRLSFWSAPIGTSYQQPDTLVVRSNTLEGFSDSVAGSTVYVRVCIPAFEFKELLPCSAPYIMRFKDLPLNNAEAPIVWGSNQSWTVNVRPPIDSVNELTSASYQIIGEYSERFTPPVDSRDWKWADAEFSFRGAPKSIVHDTLITTLTNCYGTVVTRTPIEGYTRLDVGHSYTVGKRGPSLVPFLGSVIDTIVIADTSAFPLKLSNVKVQNFNYGAFRLLSAPTVIGARDTGLILAQILDTNYVQDARDPRYGGVVTGVLSAFQQQGDTTTSGFSLYLNGAVDVYCPYVVDYIYLPPVLKHGVHPTGIVFPSDKIRSSFSSGRSFLTVYGNGDSTSQYFYVPYYDDPHFTLTIKDYFGLGSAILPALLAPDTGTGLPHNNDVEVLTEFTGDDYHNYRTQLHWPRGNDTITLDVLALGAQAGPYSSVQSRRQTDDISCWPNPASSILHVNATEVNTAAVIYDLLGREVTEGKMTVDGRIDITRIPPGMYSLVLIPSGGVPQSVKFAIGR